MLYNSINNILYSMNNNFSKYAKSNGINTLAFEQYKNSLNKRSLIKPKNMTPMVIETNQLNTSTISVFDRLMMDRIIFLGEEIDDFIANVINAQLLFLDSEEDKVDPIWMYINSPGGDCYSGLATYDTMGIISRRPNTVVMGLAASMAYVLAISGEKDHRYALQHSRLMMHQPWGGTGTVQATDMEIANREMQEVKSDLIDIMALHTGKHRDVIKIDAERDMWFRAKSAIEYGAIDKILNKI